MLGVPFGFLITVPGIICISGCLGEERGGGSGVELKDSAVLKGIRKVIMRNGETLDTHYLKKTEYVKPKWRSNTERTVCVGLGDQSREDLSLIKPDTGETCLYGVLI